MNTGRLTWIVVFAACYALGIPVRLLAQGSQAAHHHYVLIDMGTFGGPASNVIETIEFQNASGELNSRGVLVGGAATSIPTGATSSLLICGGLGGGVPNVYHAFEWHKGIVTDLGALPGGNNCSVANGVNANGEVIGNSENGELDPLTGVNQSRPVLWKDGHITDLGSFGGNQGGALGINNRGQIVGGSLNTTPDPFSIFDLLLGPFNGTQTRAYLWQDGIMRDLGTLGGPDAVAILVSNDGKVAGVSYTDSVPNPAAGTPTLHPFIWENGTMLDLGTLGGTFAFPLALNGGGQVVGQSNLVGDSTNHPFFWDRGVLTDIGTFGGDFGAANAINEAGEVVGFATNTGNQAIAFLWKNGVLTDLGTVDSDPCSTANAVNSKGQVVGISATCDFTFRRAFLWENGSMVDLNNLISPDSGMQLTLAEAINDRGEIAVNGTPSGCAVVEQCGHAVLLIPCDENHQGLEGCDYSLADAAAVEVTHLNLGLTTSGSPPAGIPTISATIGLSNRMLPRLARIKQQRNEANPIPERNDISNRTTPTSGPSVALSPTSMVFACRNVDNAGCQCTTNVKYAKLTNTGTETLNIKEITIRGDFEGSNTCGTYFGAGQSCSIGVEWLGNTSGGLVSISDNSPGSPQQVSLRGLKECSPVDGALIGKRYDSFLGISPR